MSFGEKCSANNVFSFHTHDEIENKNKQSPFIMFSPELNDNQDHKTDIIPLEINNEIKAKNNFKENDENENENINLETNTKVSKNLIKEM